MSLSKGALGEQLAKTFLLERGYTFVQANYSTRFGEIDLIMIKDDELIFVEVKTRSIRNTVSGTFDIPEQKLEKIESAALAYLDLQDECDWRVELVEVELLANGLAKIRLSPYES